MYGKMKMETKILTGHKRVKIWFNIFIVLWLFIRCFFSIRSASYAANESMKSSLVDEIV